ncbi:hypothetical protein WA026_013362 [Henosepilachna vigintioctopunctata]|uniref:Acyltransferase 3 domain-containing protein n=1 Tax=Henosepilachna vigintioctopunctata TaxID=420089 RepID=A0AAW1VBM8_9CUCU
MAFYISRKFKISLRYFGAAAIVATVFIQTFTMLTSDYGLFRFFPRNLPLENLFIKPDFLIKYFSTVNHVLTYVIGFSFGILYAQYKKKNIFDTLMKKLIWFTALFVLPIVTSILHSYNYSRPLEFFMTITLRPTFSFGIAVGFLGLATKTGGFIRNFLQCKPLVFLAHFNYCVYVFHFLVVYLRFGTTTKMVVLSDEFYVSFTNIKRK